MSRRCIHRVTHVRFKEVLPADPAPEGASSVQRQTLEVPVYKRSAFPIAKETDKSLLRRASDSIVHGSNGRGIEEDRKG